MEGEYLEMPTYKLEISDFILSQNRDVNQRIRIILKNLQSKVLCIVITFLKVPSMGISTSVKSHRNESS